MTRDDIMHIANETAGRDGWGCESHLQRFAKRIIAAEREECAQVIDQFGDDWMCDSHELAKIVRARGNK